MPRSTRKYTHCCRTAPVPQQGTSSQVGARCCVDGVPTHRRQDAVPALCPKVDAFTPDSGNNGPDLHKPRSGLVLWRTPKHPGVVIASGRSLALDFRVALSETAVMQGKPKVIALLNEALQKELTAIDRKSTRLNSSHANISYA